MRFSLRNTAGYLHDIISETYDFKLGDFDEKYAEYLRYLRYVPPSVRENINTNKSMRQGFANLFSYVATLTRREGSWGLPNEANILLQIRPKTEWPPHSKNYLTRGGTVYGVGSCLFERAMIKDEIAGDGDDDDDDDDDEKELLRKPGLEIELASLSECRNDLEYGFVSRQLGYKMVSREYYLTH